MAGKTQYKNQFISENYDRIFLTVPKGQKALIEEKAKSMNMSLNGYISSLINSDMDAKEERRPAPKKEKVVKPKATYEEKQENKKEMDVFLL